VDRDIVVVAHSREEVVPLPLKRELASLSVVFLLDCKGHGSDNADVECGTRTDAGALVCCGGDTELPGLSCVDLSQDGGEFGIYGSCRQEGQDFDGKFAGAQCCDGLVRVGSELPSLACEPAVDSLFFCVRCGDGTCGNEENHCRCPQDCPDGR
jgi:hypothetical protein